MAKGKPRWKELPFEDRTEKSLIQHGLSKELAREWKERYKKRKNK